MLLINTMLINDLFYTKLGNAVYTYNILLIYSYSGQKTKFRLHQNFFSCLYFTNFHDIPVTSEKCVTYILQVQF